MTREAKMLAVVEAARVTAREIGATGKLLDALAALDAHTEAEAQEVVTLAVWGCGGNVALTTIGSRPMTTPRDCRPPEIVDRMARAICRKRCAYMGEPPCYDSAFSGNVLWPNPECDEPGCMAFAQAAAAAIVEPPHGQ